MVRPKRGVLDRKVETNQKSLRWQLGIESGLTASRYDNRAGHRLAISDLRICETPPPSREKRYDPVLVLD